MSDEQIRQLKRDLAQLEKLLDKRLRQLLNKYVLHLKYHEENESKWGLVKIMRDHPFKTMAAGIFSGLMISVAISGITGKDIIEWIVKFFG